MELQRFQLTLILLLTRVELTLEQQPQVKEALVHTEVIAGLLVGLGKLYCLHRSLILRTMDHGNCCRSNNYACFKTS